MLMTRPPRHPFAKKVGSIAAAATFSLLTASLTLADDFEESVKLPDDSEFLFSSTGDTQSDEKGSHKDNGQSSDDKKAAEIYGKGSSRMMSTEYLIGSTDYGGGIYRRFIGTKKVRDKEVHSGKIVQELLITPETLKKGPKLVDAQDPKGLQRLGIIAAKLWLKKVMQAGNDKANDDPDKVFGACIKKPIETDVPGKYLKPGVTIHKSWYWGNLANEKKEERENCGLSLRLTSDENLSDDFMFISAQLCRYPTRHYEFNGVEDEAECVDIKQILKPKDDDQVFLSEDNERHRTERSVLLREPVRRKRATPDTQTKSEGRSYSQQAWEFVFGAEDPTVSTSKSPGMTDTYEDLGRVTEVFSAFLETLNSFSTAAYKTHLDPVYSYRVQHAVYNEWLVAIDDGTGEQLVRFLKLYPDGFKKALETGAAINLENSGIEKTISDFKFASGKLAGSVAFTMTLEKSKGITFSHNEEKLTLLDKAQIDDLTRLSEDHKELVEKLDTCYANLIQSEDQCAALENQLAQANTKLENAQKEKEDLEELISEYKKTRDEALQASIDKVKEQADTDQQIAMDALEKEYEDKFKLEQARNQKSESAIEIKYKEKINEIEGEHRVALARLEKKIILLERDVTAGSEYERRYQQVSEEFNELKVSKNKKIRQATEMLENDNKNLREQLTAQKTKAASAELNAKEEVRRHDAESRKVFYKFYDHYLKAYQYAQNAHNYYHRDWFDKTVTVPEKEFFPEYKVGEHSNGTMYFYEVAQENQKQD